MKPNSGSVNHAQIKIRAATIADACTIHQAILSMAEGLGGAGKIQSTPEDFRRFGFGPDAAFSGLIAEVDSRFAGLCLFFPIFSTWLGKPGVFVQDLYVDPDFRGQKVGEMLLHDVAAWSAEQGGVYLRLSVDAENHGAQRFYEKLGINWIEADRDHGAYGEAFKQLARHTEPEEGA